MQKEKIGITASERIIVALDVSDPGLAVKLVEELSPLGVNFKFGLELITSITTSVLDQDPQQLAMAQRLLNLGKGRVMWDTKLSDIPNTMAGAVLALGAVSPRFFTIHASCGEASIKAAIESRGESQVLGVTVLTSIGEQESRSLFGAQSLDKVFEFAKTLARLGADGIVCSPQELGILAKSADTAGLVKVIPGIRPDWAAIGDQNRIMTPAQAIRAGANYLVIGRPITKPPMQIETPVAAVERIIQEIESVR